MCDQFYGRFCFSFTIFHVMPPHGKDDILHLRHSDYVWPEDKIKLAHDNLLKDTNYDSAVSQGLITRVSEGQVVIFSS